MATLFRVSRGGIRFRCGAWIRSVVLAVAFAAALLAGSAEMAHAQTSGMTASMDGRVTGVSATVNAATMAVVGATVITLAWDGVTMTTPVGRAVGAGAAVMAPVARQVVVSAIKTGAVTGAMAAVLATLTGDTYYDPNDKAIYTKGKASDSTKASYPASQSYGFHYGAQGAFAYTGSAQDACDGEAAWNMLNFPGRVYAGMSPGGIVGSSLRCNGTWQNAPDGPRAITLSAIAASGCQQGATLRSDGLCYPVGWVDPGKSPATDAEIEAAIPAAVWPQVFQAAGCPDKITSFTDFPDPSDPCAKIVLGGTPQTPTFPNGDKVTWPDKHERVTTTSGGQTVTQDRVTSRSAQLGVNTGADARANPVTVTPVETVNTTTNDGVNPPTTTTTTTTGNTTTADQDKPDEDTAAFNPPAGDLYQKKDKTFADVLGRFQTSIMAAPWMKAATGFFNVSIGAGSCPQWSVPASHWTPALDATPYFCGPVAMTLYQLGGVIVMAVAAWAAFRIAFL